LVLEAGEKIFAALSTKHDVAETWNIRTIRGEISMNGSILSPRGKKGITHPDKMLRGKPAALLCAVNVFNEIYWGLSPANQGGLKNLAGKSAGLLGALCGENGFVLVAEPGIPRSGEFVSWLRASFLEQGLELISPCPHREACPFPGGIDANRQKAKWCHFSFDTHDAPIKLLKLSAAAGVPKERAVLSFLLAGKNPSPFLEKPAAKDRPCKVRIISDAFPVGSFYGRYGCSGLGAVLVRGSREKIEALGSGDLSEVKICPQRDPKSGALIGELL
jgi:hypothetical protein